MSERDDEARDPHLREALRHAPDAQLQAPPALGDLILKEARAKARDASRAAPVQAPGWARHLWDWLARPAVATGFAGVMAATLVGLMWWDRPMDEAMPRSPVPAAAPAPMPGQGASAATPATPTAPPAGALEAAPKPPPRRPEPARKTAVDTNTATATGGAAAPLAGTTPTSPPAAAPVPTPAAAPPATAADASADALLAKARSEEQKRERGSMAPAEAQSRRALAKAQLNESRLQLEAEAFTRVASVRAAIASEPGRWSWQRAQAPSQGMSDAVYAWLAQLDAATGTAWQPHAARETAALRGRALALLRDGQQQHSFQLTERGVLWQRGQAAWQVELPAEALATLQAALDSAAP